jgi:hypothetical protein
MNLGIIQAHESRSTSMIIEFQIWFYPQALSKMFDVIDRMQSVSGFYPWPFQVGHFEATHQRGMCGNISILPPRISPKKKQCECSAE